MKKIWGWVVDGTKSTDWFIVLLTAVIAAVSYYQWRAIQSGGADTHALAQAAKTQATNMANLVTQTQAQIKEMQTEHRPWVSGEIGFDHAPTIYFYPNNPVGTRVQTNLSLNIAIKNVGGSPAFRVDMEPRAIVSTTVPGPPDLGVKMNSACTSADGNSTRDGGVLFPNGPEQRTQFPMAVGNPVLRVDDIKRIWVAICIAYSGAPSGGELHHTKIWTASWPTESKPALTGRNGILIAYSFPAALRWSVVKTDAN